MFRRKLNNIVVDKVEGLAKYNEFLQEQKTKLEKI